MTTNKKIFISIIVCMIFHIFSTTILSAGNKEQDINTAILDNWPPQYMTDKDTGKPTGFAIDVMNQIAAVSDLKINYVKYTRWPEIHNAIRNNEAVVVPNMGITKERLNLYDFTIPYDTFRISIFVRKSTTNINGINDLAKKKVAVVESNKGFFLIKKKKEIHLQLYPSFSKAFLSLLSGNTDALVYPESVVLRMARQSGLEKKIKIVGKPLIEIKRGIAVKKEETVLFETLNTAMQKFITTAEYKKIYKKWFGTPEPLWTTTKVMIVMASLLVLTITMMMGWHYRSILRLNRELQNIISELNQYKERLEGMVAKRTAELESKNNELETFTYSVSHDLKAPLRGIDGYSRLLAQDYTDKLDEEGLLFLKNIRHSTQQMNQLIEDLLAYSRMERRDIQFIPIDLPLLVDSLIQEREQDFLQRKIKIKKNIPFQEILCDRESIRQILGNLLDNAIKFTKDKSVACIEINGDENSNEWIICVKDNGAGFDPKYQKRIFGMFQRLHHSEDYPGTGVGLAIVKKAVLRIGGSIRAQGELDRGAVFYVQFPKPGKTDENKGAIDEKSG
jgi:signal transduction histidine kinase/ABC-type amino acid transport substrate-binding protein